MKTAILLIVLGLAGCSAVAEVVPSFKYCDQVTYTRVGTDIDLKAKCKAPVG